MDRKGNRYTLSTGRVIDANQGLLCPMDDGVLAEGYDGTVDRSWGPDPECDIQPALTPVERREIAEYMIARWQAWAGPVAIRVKDIEAFARETFGLASIPPDASAGE